MNAVSQNIIDTCCLLDLYAGWDGLEPLAQLDCEWYVCPATLKEARYLRDTDTEGNTTKVPIELTTALDQELVVYTDTTEEEFNSFLQLATALGDGEAMSLAIAMHRRWTLATDDGKAARTAIEAGVDTLSTPQIVKAWAEKDESNLADLPIVLQSIEKRAHFRPARNSQLYAWWNRNAAL